MLDKSISWVKTVFSITENAQKIVTISTKSSSSTQRINKLAGELGRLMEEIMGHG